MLKQRDQGAGVSQAEIDFECIHWRKIRSLKDEAAELAVQAKATGQSFQLALNHLCDFGSSR
jgi:hypothetical protein